MRPVHETLGVSLKTAQTIEDFIRHGCLFRMASASGVRSRTLSMRLLRARRMLGVENNVKLCMLYDRLQHGMPNAKALEGLTK